MQPTTSLKLPPQLKKRMASFAADSGKSLHAFLVQIIEKEAQRLQNRRQFIEEALESEREMLRTGMGYRMEEVHAYFRARAAGKNPKRPKLRKWRK